ncbi:YihY/virulence factor BrkB family protein [Rhodohalobacter halophilus]|uniref:YihY/virulence factor BrkB family protein n=1 Tax=Rhodohalobacter halophilus TaxID=1812810 RepID=UPI00083FA061|nr:YihY/virulence factor BrkB family protein [Rhodohalobacter halophilus]
MPLPNRVKTLLRELQVLLLRTFKKAADDEIMTRGAAIAFYTIFSITPLIILVVYFGGIFLSEEIVSGQLTEYLGDYLDEALLDNLIGYITTQQQQHTGFITTIIAAGTVIFGATTVISQIKTTLNKIWNVDEIKINSAWHFLLNRLLSFGMIIVLSLLLLTSLVAELLLAIAASYFQELFPAFEIDMYGVIAQIITILFAVSFFTLIFRILPDVHARWIDVMVGALVTTILFLIGKYLIGLFFTTTGIEATYRAAGSLVVFIIWVYYNIQTILLGAVFTQVYTDLFGGRIRPYKFVSLKNFEIRK